MWLNFFIIIRREIMHNFFIVYWRKMHNNTCLNSYLLSRAESLWLRTPFDYGKVFVYLGLVLLRKSEGGKRQWHS